MCKMCKGAERQRQWSVVYLRQSNRFVKNTVIEFINKKYHEITCMSDLGNLRCYSFLLLSGLVIYIIIVRKFRIETDQKKERKNIQKTKL